MVDGLASACLQLRHHSQRREPPAAVGSETSGRSGLEIRVARTSVPVASSIALKPDDIPLSPEWRGHVGMWCLIAAESAIFSIFVVAYLYYDGKSLGGPTPNEVLRVPVLGSICLFSSSLTIVMAERAIERGALGRFGLWWFLTIALGLVFITGT